MDKNRNDPIKKPNENLMQSSSRRSQQSTTDTLAKLRRMHEQRASQADLKKPAPQINLGPRLFDRRKFWNWSQVGLVLSPSFLFPVAERSR